MNMGLLDCITYISCGQFDAVGWRADRMSPLARNRYSPLIACQFAMRNGKTSLSFHRHRRTIACGWKYAKLACNRPSVSRENKSNKQAGLRWAKPKCAKTENHVTFILTIVRIAFVFAHRNRFNLSGFQSRDCRHAKMISMFIRDNGNATVWGRGLFFSSHGIFQKN